MASKEHDLQMTRRQALGLGAALAAGLALPRVAWSADGRRPAAADPASQTPLPASDMGQIIGTPAHVVNGVVGMKVARTDIGNVQGPNNVTFTPAFVIAGMLYFQPAAGGKSFLNADVCLKPEEVNPFVSALIKHVLAVQAFHQHFPMLNPQVWFVHFRGHGDPRQLAQGVRAALGTTSTPLPQSSPKSASSPLDHNRLAKILRGNAMVGNDGVVKVLIPRSDQISISGVKVRPQTNISTHVAFKPEGQGANATAVPDFSMLAPQVDKVLHLMGDQQGWFLGCLYNQETDEHPQLYFAHFLKTGDAYQLAREVRKGLDLTHAKGR